MHQEPDFHFSRRRGGYGDTLRTTVHTSIHKEYKGNGPYRPLKTKITSKSTYSQPYIHKNPSYRPIPTQTPHSLQFLLVKPTFPPQKHIPYHPKCCGIAGGC